MAKYLDLTKEEYRNILKSCGGYSNENETEIIFKTEEDAQKAVEKLEPHYILAKLTK